MHDNLKSVENLLSKVEKFDSMTGSQQAAFRAQLTRLLNRVNEPELKGYLERVKEMIGEPASRAYQRLTPAELVTEYQEKYLEYSGRQRAAFKAKLSRMLKTAEKADNAKDAETLAELKERIAEDEVKSRLNRIRTLAKSHLSEVEPETE